MCSLHRSSNCNQSARIVGSSILVLLIREPGSMEVWIGLSRRLREDCTGADFERRKRKKEQKGHSERQKSRVGKFLFFMRGSQRDTHDIHNRSSVDTLSTGPPSVTGSGSPDKRLRRSRSLCVGWSPFQSSVGAGEKMGSPICSTTNEAETVA